MKKATIGVLIFSLIAFSAYMLLKQGLFEKPVLTNTEKSLQFCLFNLLPISSDNADKILKQHVSVIDSEKLVMEGYSFSFSKLADSVEIKEPGFLIINENIEYDEIKSFRVFINPINGVRLIEFIGTKHTNISAELYSQDNSIFLANINNNYLKQNRVAVNKINALSDSGFEAETLTKTISYIQTKLKGNEIYILRENNDTTGLQQEIVDNYQLKLYQISEIPTRSFYIANFSPKKDDPLYEDFSVFILNGEIINFGFYSKPMSFSINNSCYIGFHRAVVLNSGFWGKELFCLENGQLKLIKCDYSFAD